MTTGRRDDVPPPLGPAPRLQQLRVDQESQAQRLGKAAGRLPFTNTDDAWNARGKADKAVVADTLRTLMGPAAADPYVKHLERAIDALDRE